MSEKKKFEVKTHFDESSGMYRRDVYINEMLFDYEVDQDSLAKAKELGGLYYEEVQRDIQKHLLECLSDFLGRKVTAAQLMQAIQTGWI